MVPVEPHFENDGFLVKTLWCKAFPVGGVISAWHARLEKMKIFGSQLLVTQYVVYFLKHFFENRILAV